MKIMIFSLRTLLFITCLMYFSSCEDFHDTPQAFPYKELSSTNWGFLDYNGEKIVNGQYENRPSVVINDIFFVESYPFYQIYNIKDPDKAVGDKKYSSIAYFRKDITPAVFDEKGIVYINRDGEEVFRLPKKYIRASAFRKDGYSYAIYLNENGEMQADFVDTKGKFYKYDDIKDKNDDTCFLPISSDYYVFYEDGRFGLKKSNGEKILPANYRQTKKLEGNYCAFEDSEGFHIFNADKQEFLNGIYFDVYQMSSNLDCFIAQSKRSKGFDLFDMNGNKISFREYDYLAFIGKGKVIAKEHNKNNVDLIDKKGNVIKTYYSIYMGDYAPFKIDEYTAFNTDMENDWERDWSKAHDTHEMIENFTTNYGDDNSHMDACFYDTRDLVMLIMNPTSGACADNLLSFYGKNTEQVINDYGLNPERLLRRDNRNHVGDRNWCPFLTEFTQKYEWMTDVRFDCKYGGLYVSAGFENIWCDVDGPESYLELNNKCDIVSFTLDPIALVKAQIDNYSRGLDYAMLSLGFQKDETMPEWERFNKYTNNGITVYMYFNAGMETIVGYIKANH